MNDIFAKDLSGEMVSPDEPGEDELIADIFATIKTATEMNTGYRTPEDGWLRTGDLGSMDSNGNIFIRGRLKTMILSSSGQNIFPEELETKLNTLPFILESLVIERNKKLVALVYADYEALDSLGLNNPDNLKTIMDENLKNLNSNVAAYEKISKIQLYPTEFEKTPKRSIKRYLYNSIAVD